MVKQNKQTKNPERIQSEKCKSFPPFPCCSEGIPVTTFLYVPPEMWAFSLKRE